MKEAIARVNPLEIGKSLKVWKTFKQRRTEQMGSAPMRGISQYSENFVVCLWLEKSPDPRFALRQCMTQIGKGWGLQIFTTSAMENWIRSALADWSHVGINILEHEDAGVLDRNKLLRTEVFWRQTVGENLLLIDADTIVCRSETAAFTKFDYVAPLWSSESELSPWCRFGSGELSFRHKRAMIEICRSCNTNDWLFPSEGVFYSIMLRVEGSRFNLPSDEIAGAFGVEQVAFPQPFALHRTWQYLTADTLSSILQSI